MLRTPLVFVNDKYQDLCKLIQDIDKKLCGKVDVNDVFHVRCLVKSVRINADNIFKEYVSLVHAYEHLDQRTNPKQSESSPGNVFYQQRPQAIDPSISLRREYYKLKSKHKKLKKKYKKLSKKYRKVECKGA